MAARYHLTLIKSVLKKKVKTVHTRSQLL